MIGGTILSWGETVPELAATYTLAKAGQGTMALAACFGCPIFNLLMGLGLPVLFKTGVAGALPLLLTNGIFLLILQSVRFHPCFFSLSPERRSSKWRLL